VRYDEHPASGISQHDVLEASNHTLRGFLWILTSGQVVGDGVVMIGSYGFGK
jgi:hypothetical protein